MRLILMCSLFLCAKAAISIIDVFPKIADRCNKDIALAQEFLGLLNKDHHISKDAQCFMACFYKIYGVMGEDGRYHLSEVLHTLQGVEAADADAYEKMKTLMIACIKEVEANPDPDYCQHAENFAKCAIMTAHKMGLPPEKYYVANLEDL